MTKLLFVCHGNICRSPMAEFVMKALVRRAGAEDRFFVASAAVSPEEWGNPVYPPARRTLLSRGIDPGDKRAVPLEKADYGKYDLLIGMDAGNLRGMKRICGGDPEGKMFLLPEAAGCSRDIEDPWYTGDFETAYREIEKGCRALLGKLLPGSARREG